jgi:poly-gamma-glutamate synthesis protein (capsule biosynthesis protein)
MKKLVVISAFVVVGITAYLAHVSSQSPLVYVADKKVSALSSTQETPTTPLLFTGDIMLGRYVETLQERGLNPFGSTTEFLNSHVTISNLEGPIPEVHEHTPNNAFAFSFPSTTPQYLKSHGVQAVSLANNHSLDQGHAGYEHTKLVLDKESVAHFGGYGSDATDYFETHLGTTTVIVFGINMISSQWNERMIFDTVTFLRKKHPQAYLTTFIHWGNEYSLTQNTVQEAFAHRLIDVGVDAIIGSHPHVVEGVEVYRGRPIFYSLGNFIFDQYFSKEVQEGVMVSIDKKNETFIYTLVPIVSVRSKVSFADEMSSREILSTIARSSSPQLQEDVEKGEIVVLTTK